MPDTPKNRIQSFALIIAVSTAVCLSICFSASSFSQLHQECEIKLNGRINPNTAPVCSLVRLPGIGIGRAEAIAAYRDSLKQQQRTTQAFQSCDDLQKIKGIGPKTVRNIRQWLKFE